MSDLFFHLAFCHFLGEEDLPRLFVPCPREIIRCLSLLSFFFCCCFLIVVTWRPANFDSPFLQIILNLVCWRLVLLQKLAQSCFKRSPPYITLTGSHFYLPSFWNRKMMFTSSLYSSDIKGANRICHPELRGSYFSAPIYHLQIHRELRLIRHWQSGKNRPPIYLECPMQKPLWSVKRKGVLFLESKRGYINRKTFLSNRLSETYQQGCK